MKLMGAGRTADVFSLQDDKVIKLYKEGFPMDAVQTEFAMNRLVYAQGIMTPQPLEMTVLDNRHGIVFQRVSGTSLLYSMSK